MGRPNQLRFVSSLSFQITLASSNEALERPQATAAIIYTVGTTGSTPSPVANDILPVAMLTSIWHVAI